MERDTLYTLVALGLIVCMALTAGCVGRGKRAGKQPPPTQPPAKPPPGPAATDVPAATAAPSEPAAPITETDLDVEDIADIEVPDLSDDDLEVPEIPEDDLTLEEPDFAEETELDVGDMETAA